MTECSVFSVHQWQLSVFDLHLVDKAKVLDNGPTPVFNSSSLNWVFYLWTLDISICLSAPLSEDEVDLSSPVELLHSYQGPAVALVRHLLPSGHRVCRCFEKGLLGRLVSLQSSNYNGCVNYWTQVLKNPFGATTSRLKVCQLMSQFTLTKEINLWTFQRMFYENPKKNSKCSTCRNSERTDRRAKQPIAVKPLEKSQITMPQTTQMANQPMWQRQCAPWWRRSKWPQSATQVRQYIQKVEVPAGV